jgi:hypothetical protein
MRTIGRITAAAGFLCATAFGACGPVMAQGYYYGGGPYGYERPAPLGYTCTYLGCCPQCWRVQGGVCKPYRGPVGGPPNGPYGDYRPHPPGYACTYADCCPRGMSV